MKDVSLVPASADAQRPNGRVEGVDFIRGTALLVIMVDHVELCCGVKVLSQITLHRWGLSDALEIFVFLSGFVFGLSSDRSLSRGFVSLQLKALCRSGVLILANVFTFIFVLFLLMGLLPLSMDAVVEMNFLHAISSPLASTIQLAFLRFQPFGFGILRLYASLLVVMPTMLWVLRRSKPAAILVSFGIYGCVQLWPTLNFENYNGVLWTINPFAWQFLFVCGMLTSCFSRQLPSVSIPTSVILFVVAVALTCLVNSHSGFEFFHRQVWLIRKQTLGPIRLLHFCLIVLAIIPAVDRFPECALRSLVVSCGRFPLEVFIYGLIVTYVAKLGSSFSSGVSTFTFVVFECAAIGGAFLLACFLAQTDRRTASSC
ncbi:MAG: OpgC domain-containing protein [Planctomycetota bacterium]